MSTLKPNQRHEAKHPSQHQEPPPKPTATEKRFLKALHWMRCPNCGLPLTSEYRGFVAIDRCPACGGVWLDAATLEALLAPAKEELRSAFRNHCRQ